MRPDRSTTFTAGRRQLRRRRRVMLTSAVGLCAGVVAAAVHTGLAGDLTDRFADEVAVEMLAGTVTETFAGVITTVERHTGTTIAATVAGPRPVATGERVVAVEEPARPAAAGDAQGGPTRPGPAEFPSRPVRPEAVDASDQVDATALIASADLEPGDTDDADGGVVRVAEVQQRLRDERFLIGPVDGRMGQQTVAAVMAFQQAAGLAVDGVVGPETRAALAVGVPEPALRGGPPTRVEVDLDAQVLHVVEDDVRLATLKVSSGDGGTYRSISGGTARSRTPVGEFTIQRRIRGVRVSRLGTLYDPLYFYGGFAIHGSPSVPPGPASHGCIRVTRADGRWLFDQVPNGTPVVIHGGTHVFSPRA